MYQIEDFNHIKLKKEKRSERLGVFIPTSPFYSREGQWKGFLEWVEINKVPIQEIFFVYNNFEYLKKDIHRLKYLWIQSFDSLLYTKPNGIADVSLRNELQVLVRKNKIVTFTTLKSHKPHEWVFTRIENRYNEGYEEILD